MREKETVCRGAAVRGSAINGGEKRERLFCSSPHFLYFKRSFSLYTFVVLPLLYPAQQGIYPSFSLSLVISSEIQTLKLIYMEMLYDGFWVHSNESKFDAVYFNNCFKYELLSSFSKNLNLLLLCNYSLN